MPDKGSGHTTGYVPPESPTNSAAINSTAAENYMHSLEVQNTQLHTEIEAIKNSRSYRFLMKLKSLPVASALYKLILRQNKDETLVTNSPMKVNVDSTEKQRSVKVQERNETDILWLEKQIKDPKPLSINHPNWRGIMASAGELYANIYTIPDSLTEQEAIYCAGLFRDAHVPSITIQGMPLTYYHLALAMKKVVPEVPVYAIWHGNFLYSKEDYDWQAFRLLCSLYREGYIQKVGFVKHGMAEVMERAGVHSFFVMNFVRRIPKSASKVLDGGPHLGIWAEPDWGWKKLPYAMLSSTKLLPEANVHAYNIGSRAEEFGYFLSIKGKYHIDALDHSTALNEMKSMHLNMNVSLTECAPMLPLESLSLGVPCLLGPTSHYFLDDEYLHRRLVVQYPDNPAAIARAAQVALDEREQIIDAYKSYAPGYNERALKNLAEFLEN